MTLFEQTCHRIIEMIDDYRSRGPLTLDRAEDLIGNIRVKCKDAIEYVKLFPKDKYYGD